MAHNMPMKNPATTWGSVCCCVMMRLEPTTPASSRAKQSHHTGLKANISAKATMAPVTPPAAAVCVDTFHFMFNSEQSTCIISDASTMRLVFVVEPCQSCRQQYGEENDDDEDIDFLAPVEQAQVAEGEQCEHSHHRQQEW